MNIIAAIYFGHSHLASMIPFLYHRPLDLEKNGREVEHYVFDIYNNRGVFSLDESKIPYGMDGNDHLFNRELLDRVDLRISGDREIVYISLFGGNSHNALTLVSGEREFDFISPQAPDLPLDPAREQVPSGLVRDAIARNCEIYINDLVALRKTTQRPVYHIISPPPIEDDAVVASIIGSDPFFANLGAKITPALIRYKAWLMHKQIYEDACAQNGIVAIQVPEQAIVDGKWLAPGCIGGDPTHGNLHYGGLIFQEVEKTLSGHFAGWDWIR